MPYILCANTNIGLVACIDFSHRKSNHWIIRKAKVNAEYY